MGGGDSMRTAAAAAAAATLRERRRRRQRTVYSTDLYARLACATAASSTALPAPRASACITKPLSPVAVGGGGLARSSASLEVAAAIALVGRSDGLG